MVKAIIFDLQGTLVENGVFPSPMKQAKYILRIDAPFSDFVMRFERAFMIKQHSSLKEAFGMVCEEFHVMPKDFVLEKLIGLWNKNKLLSKLYPDTLPAIQKLKEKYVLILVANIDCFSREMVEKHKLGEYFNEMVLSCDAGMLKSDKGFYNTILNKLGLDTDDVVIVGDSIESDMETARNAGIKGILLDRNDRREYSNKILSLNDLENYLGE
ncbi:MAG: HAD family hydrolase [Candidatus Woesearchaeota archaeon]